ncbi:MAG: c-type cytochrome, partial [Gaiellaceae bacterium]
WSESLAKWHIWLTFIGVTVNSAFWLWQGLEGAPRRFSTLPSGYEASTRAALPFVAMIAVAQVLFVVNMWQTLTGAEPRPARQKGDGMLLAAEGAITMIAVFLALGAGAAGFFLGRGTSGSHTKTVTVRGAAAETPPPGNAQGKQVFTSNCAGCHTLKDAGTEGTVGPNLDEAKPPKALVVNRVTNGKGQMPSFKGELSDAQIQAVAAYVASAAAR